MEAFGGRSETCAKAMRSAEGTPTLRGSAGLRRGMGLAFGSGCVSQALTRLPLAPRTAERGRSAAVMGAGIRRPAPRRRGAEEKLAFEREERGEVRRHEPGDGSGGNAGL
ncbi:hypothetical protein Ssi03_43460 [Sphaerisporangium siamense]|nr:hypothetical protein Ssi03_43460 [Sphaerisporangium siamense]